MILWQLVIFFVVWMTFYSTFYSILTLKLAPQEQPCSALGLLIILKADLINSVSKSKVDPRRISKLVASIATKTLLSLSAMWSKMSSPSHFLVISNLYWKPEQPPPSTLTRRKVPFSSRISESRFLQASVITSVSEDARSRFDPTDDARKFGDVETWRFQSLETQVKWRVCVHSKVSFWMETVDCGIRLVIAERKMGWRFKRMVLARDILLDFKYQTLMINGLEQHWRLSTCCYFSEVWFFSNVKMTLRLRINSDIWCGHHHINLLLTTLTFDVASS